MDSCDGCKNNGSYNCVVLLGPTAVGKTAVGVSLAHHFGQAVISADSRQVYKGLDIGSGKDIAEYTIAECDGDGVERKVTVPYYLIDVTTLAREYTVFDYQQDFYKTFSSLTKQHPGSAQRVIPFVVGGTGMYLDAVIRGYDFVPVPQDETLRAELAQKSLESLDQMLIELKPDLHNKSDLLIRDRVVRAIEIALFMKSPACVELRKTLEPRPEINPFVLGTTIPREMLRKNIERRLRERLDGGMIEEVKALHDGGASWDRLERLGLEYRYVSLYLEGKIESREALFAELYHEITQFAKRQETWFRGMERKGVNIHWLPQEVDKEARYHDAVCVLQQEVFLDK